MRRLSQRACFLSLSGACLPRPSKLQFRHCGVEHGTGERCGGRGLADLPRPRRLGFGGSEAGAGALVAALRAAGGEPDQASQSAQTPCRCVEHGRSRGPAWQVTCNSWAKARKNLGGGGKGFRRRKEPDQSGGRSKCVAELLRLVLAQTYGKMCFESSFTWLTRPAPRHVMSRVSSGFMFVYGQRQLSERLREAASCELKVDAVGATAAVSASPRWRSSLHCVATLRLSRSGCEPAPWLSSARQGPRGPAAALAWGGPHLVLRGHHAPERRHHFVLSSQPVAAGPPDSS